MFDMADDFRRISIDGGPRATYAACRELAVRELLAKSAGVKGDR